MCASIRDTRIWVLYLASWTFGGLTSNKCSRLIARSCTAKRYFSDDTFSFWLFKSLHDVVQSIHQQWQSQASHIKAVIWPRDRIDQKNANNNAAAQDSLSDGIKQVCYHTTLVFLMHSTWCADLTYNFRSCAQELACMIWVNSSSTGGFDYPWRWANFVCIKLFLPLKWLSLLCFVMTGEAVSSSPDWRAVCNQGGRVTYKFLDRNTMHTFMKPHMMISC